MGPHALKATFLSPTPRVFFLDPKSELSKLHFLPVRSSSCLTTMTWNACTTQYTPRVTRVTSVESHLPYRVGRTVVIILTLEMKKLRPSNVRSHTLSGTEKLRPPALIHAFYHMPFTANLMGLPLPFLVSSASNTVRRHYTHSTPSSRLQSPIPRCGPGRPIPPPSERTPGSMHRELDK